MNVDIRKYIKENFKGNNEKEIRESIEESIKSKEEVILPGLGVFFEILYENVDEDIKEEIVDILKYNLQ